MTFGGLSTSSEVERLVSSSHAAAAEERKKNSVNVWLDIRVNTGVLSYISLGKC